MFTTFNQNQVNIFQTSIFLASKRHGNRRKKRIGTYLFYPTAILQFFLLGYIEVQFFLPNRKAASLGTSQQGCSEDVARDSL